MCTVWMDVRESKKVLEKQSTEETTRPPLLPAENKNGTTRRSRIREVSSRYKSPTPSAASGPKRSPSPSARRISSVATATVPPTPSAASGPKRCPSPTARRTSSVSTATVPKRAISAERKRPSAPSQPPSPSSSTPVRDTNAETLLASRKTVSNKLPESLWPSTMRSPSTSFQSDAVSVPVGKREITVSHMPSDRTLRPSSNVAQKGETPLSRKPTPERKRSPLKVKKSADQSENSKPVDSSHARLLDQHRWPVRTSEKMLTSLNRSDITDKMNKTSSLSHPRMGSSSGRRLSLDGASKPLQKSGSDLLMLLSRDDSQKEISCGSSVDEGSVKRQRPSSSSSSSLFLPRMGPPSRRRLSPDGATKPSEKSGSNLLMQLPHDDSRKQISCGSSIDDGSLKLRKPSSSSSSSSSLPRKGIPSRRRLSLDGATKPSEKSGSDLLMQLSHNDSRKEISCGSSVDDGSLKIRRPSSSTSSSASLPRKVIPSHRRLSLDGATKPSEKSGSDLLMQLSHDDSRKEISCGSSVDDGSLNIQRPSSSSSSSASLPRKGTPSRRRLSVDGATKPSEKFVSDFLMQLSHDDSRKEISCGDSVDDGSLKMQRPSSSSSSSASLPRLGTPSYRRLSLDRATKSSERSANDLFMILSQDDGRKEISCGSFVDDGSRRIQRPSSSSSSSDRKSLVNTAARAQCLPTSASRPGSPSVSRGVSPSRARAVHPSSRGTSPVRVRPSSPSRQLQSSTSVLSFIADIKKGKSATNNIEDVHQLRLLYNRHLQWQYVNARNDAALCSQKVKAEKMLYSVWRTIVDLCNSVRETRTDLLHLRLKLKLYSALYNQLTCLDEWASIEIDHTNSLTWAIQDLQASTVRVPVTGKAMVDIKTLKAALSSAVDMMQAIGSSLCSTLSQVEEMNCLVRELADAAAQERAMFHECESLLGSIAALQMEEHSLRSHLLQMKQASRNGEPSIFGH